MPKSKAKTKRDPKSKPKNKTTFLGESHFRGEQQPLHELKRKKQLRENFFYTMVMVLMVAMFVGVPVASYLGAKNGPTDSQDKPAVSSTPNVNLETGVDGHLSDGSIDPSVVEENDLDKYQKQREEQQTTNTEEAPTTTENGE